MWTWTCEKSFSPWIHLFGKCCLVVWISPAGLCFHFSILELCMIHTEKWYSVADCNSLKQKSQLRTKCEKSSPKPKKFQRNRDGNNASHYWIGAFCTKVSEWICNGLALECTQLKFIPSLSAWHSFVKLSKCICVKDHHLFAFIYLLSFCRFTFLIMEINMFRPLMFMYMHYIYWAG